MLASLSKALTSPAAGPTALAAALALAVLLALSWAGGARREAALKAQVASLTQANAEADTRWRTQLATCRAEAAEPFRAPMEGRVTRIVQDGDEAAARLATQGPAGFDVCARMEAADAAVLASLRGR